MAESAKRSTIAASKAKALIGNSDATVLDRMANTDGVAAKQESKRLDSHGGAKSGTNHNKIESPGKKMRIEENPDAKASQ